MASEQQTLASVSPALTASTLSISEQSPTGHSNTIIVALNDDAMIQDIPNDLILGPSLMSNDSEPFEASRTIVPSHFQEKTCPPPPSSSASDSVLEFDKRHGRQQHPFLINDSGSHQHLSNNKKNSRKHMQQQQKQPWKKLLWIKQDYDDNYTDTSFLSQLKRNSTVVNYSFLSVVRDFFLIVLHLSVIMSVILVFYGIYQLHWNPVTPTLVSTITTMLCFIIYVITLNIQRSRELIALQKYKIEQLSMSTRARRIRNVSGPSSRSSSPFAGLDNRSRAGFSNISLNNNNSGNVNSTTSASFSNLDLEQYLMEPKPPSLISTLKSSVLILLSLLTFSPVLKSLTNSTASDSIWALTTASTNSHKQ
ncbi:unnamed protein product [Ambrosiozyma monospora]|uniref:Unnamed protein product n=1 Tax=Ambrosiozyma monospora TaxID=43982 RepID=A0A9W7DKB8_AMBMO|nr:unnamed protein product [Ambrosiozyma monospora]